MAHLIIQLLYFTTFFYFGQFIMVSDTKKENHAIMILAYIESKSSYEYDTTKFYKCLKK